jgi:hypothetical protein
LAFLVALFTLIGAILLRAGCALYNWLAKRWQPTRRVPEPLFGKAMGITFVTSVVCVIVGFVIFGPLVGPDGTVAAARGGGTALAERLLSLSVSLLVTAGMNAALLPTTFIRGFLVALCSLVVALFVGLVVGGVILGIGLVYSLIH